MVHWPKRAPASTFLISHEPVHYLNWPLSPFILIIMGLLSGYVAWKHRERVASCVWLGILQETLKKHTHNFIIDRASWNRLEIYGLNRMWEEIGRTRVKTCIICLLSFKIKTKAKSGETWAEAKHWAFIYQRMKRLKWRDRG